MLIGCEQACGFFRLLFRWEKIMARVGARDGGGFVGVAPSAPSPAGQLAFHESPVRPPRAVAAPASTSAVAAGGNGANGASFSASQLKSDAQQQAEDKLAVNWREIESSRVHGVLQACTQRLRYRLSAAMSLSAIRAAQRSESFGHLRPRTVVLITDPGPDPDDAVALLMAASLHLQERIVLAAVICNGGGSNANSVVPESRNRAALARAILDHFNLNDVPVGVGHPTLVEHRPGAHEYAFPGYAKVDDARLLDAQALLSSVLDLVGYKSLTVVVLSALSDVAALVARDGERFAAKVECVSVMGGVELEDDGSVRTAPAPAYLRPDEAANNLFDRAAAQAVYSYCAAARVPMRVVSRVAVPNVPMRIVRTFAGKNPYDPVMKYLKNASQLGLVSLWQRICRGQVPNRDRRWFFLTFCGVSPAEFEQLRADELGEDYPIDRRLDGTVKSYDVTTLLAALHDPADDSQQLFGFEGARVRVNEMDHYFFVQPKHLAVSKIVVEHLQLLYQFVTARGKWSIRGQYQQARLTIRLARAGLAHILNQGHVGWVMCGVPGFIDGRECICSGSFDGTVRLWDVWTGGCVKVVRHNQEATVVVAAAAADAAATPVARRAGRWPRLAPRKPPPPPPLPLPIASIAASQPGADGSSALFYYGLDNGSIQVWNAAERDETSVMVLRDEHHQHPAQVTTLLLIDSDCSLLSAGGSDATENVPDANEIFQWNLKFSVVVARYQSHSQWIRSMAAAPDSRSFYSCSNDGTICRWPVLPTATRLARTAAVIKPDLIIRPLQIAELVVMDPLRNAWVRSIALEDNGLHLFSAGNDQTLRRWDTRTGGEERVYLGHEHKLASVCVPRGEAPLFVFSGSNDGFILQWSIARGCILNKIECRTAITFITLAQESWVRRELRRDDGSVAYDYRVRIFSGHYDTTVPRTRAVPSARATRVAAPTPARTRGWLPLPCARAPELAAEAPAPLCARTACTAHATGTPSCAPRRPQVMMWETSALVDADVEPVCVSHREDEGADGESPQLTHVVSVNAASALTRSFHNVTGAGNGASASSAELPYVKTMPRSSAVKFTHMPISSVLTATLDGPMVTFSGVLYALAHPTWKATGASAITQASDALMFGIEQLVVSEDQFAFFQGIYWLMCSFASLTVVLFVSRAHERCVYALRQVDTKYVTDFERKGATRVVYKSRFGHALNVLERFLVYFIIVLGGAGFFMISRYLLQVLKCVDGRWDVNAQFACYSTAHVRYIAVSSVVFPLYIFIAARLSASYNDVTYLSEVEDVLPSTPRKLRQLFTFWGSTVVKRAGWFTRHPRHGWKFGISGRLCILVNWLADLMIEQQAEPLAQSTITTNLDLRWGSVVLWLGSAFILLRFATLYQPMAEPFSCKVLFVFRALFAVAYVELALVNILTITLVHAGHFASREQFLQVSGNYSLALWAAVSIAAVPAAWAYANRIEWHSGSKTAEEIAIVVRKARKHLKPQAHAAAAEGGGAQAEAHERAADPTGIGTRIARRVRLSLNIRPQVSPHDAANRRFDETSHGFLAQTSGDMSADDDDDDSARSPAKLSTLGISLPHRGMSAKQPPLREAPGMSEIPEDDSVRRSQSDLDDANERASARPPEHALMPALVLEKAPDEVDAEPARALALPGDVVDREGR
jgi:WD40 repeat protein/inosine-uridine nucleoside N-ribohydrolase